MTRWAAPAAAVFVATFIAGAVAVTFGARVADVSDEPLAPDHRNFTGVPIELVFTPTADGDRTSRVPLQMVGATTAITGADEVQIAFATFVTSPDLREASLIDSTGQCRFVPAPGEALRNNATTRFLRQSDCAQSSATFELVIRVGAAGRLALWAYDVAITEPVPAGFMMNHTRTHDRGHILRGRVIRTGPGPGVQRVALVAHAWTGDPQVLWLWLGLAAAWSVLALGLVVATWPQWTTSAAGAAGWGRLPPSLGVAAVAFAISALWAIVIPPLQGADEPDHLLSYAEVVGRKDFESPLADLARRAHFERIRFHGSEHFRPLDRAAPAAVAWTGDIHSERMDRRSPLTVALWKLADATVVRPHPMPPSELLLRLRLFNAALFAVAMGAAAWLIRGATASRWTWLPLAAIPSLAYFGMAVSDWAFVTSGAVLLAGALIATATERCSHATRGAALGLALAWLASASISSLALAPMVLAVLVARLLLGPVEGASGPRALQFWGTFTLGLGAGWWMTSDLLLVGYARYDAEHATGRLLLDSVNTTMRLVADAPWLLLILPILAMALEVALKRVRAHAPVTSVGRAVLKSSMAVVGSTTLIVLAASAWMSLPTLRPMEILPYPSVRSYVEAVVGVFATGLRITNIDHLTFASFWSGFGWIDTILPAPWLAALAALTAGGVAIHALTAATASSGRTATWMTAMVVGAFGSVGALAVAGFLMRRNVHGRYLIGLYVPLVLMSWQGWAHICARPGAVRTSIRVILVSGLAVLHAAALVFVIHRYY